MMRVGEIIQAVETIAPFTTALDWDNSGLLVGDKNAQVERVLIALDVTSQVVQEAKRKGANLIISHHPVIFGGGRKKLVPGDPAVDALIAGIAVISAHTNWDMAQLGVNKALADTLGLKNQQPLALEKSRCFQKLIAYVPATHADVVFNAMCEAGGGILGDYSAVGSLTDVEGRFTPKKGADPYIGAVGQPCRVVEKAVGMLVHPDRMQDVLLAMKKAHPYEEPAYDIYENKAVTDDCWLGVVGSLPASMGEIDFARLLGEKLGLAPRFNPGSRNIRRVAVCGGSGADYLKHAKGVDAFVTGDVKHHQFIEAASSNITLYDAGHYATEQVSMPQLCKLLQQRLAGVTVELSAAYSGQVVSV
ncbi:MAG: Nif3-like dinuclear metal center hexameric protein [Angelakisella sp.]|nr:Nif3-like dinuclear metal center hexameric protein [Angelakisella sp.]